jgi:hypothetical protein
MKNIFISYSHQDEKWKDLIVKHLEVLAGAYRLTVWEDRRIETGREWQPEIETALAAADTALLLISTDFLNSAFIMGKEVPVILRRREEEGVWVIPVILHPCSWKKVEWLAPLQAFPKDGIPLPGMGSARLKKLLSLLAETVAAGPRDREEQVEGADKAAVTCLITRLPKRKIDLIGRDSELALLARKLHETQRVLLVHGLGGIGKTEVCKTFFLDNYKHYAYAGWIDWVSSLKESLVNAVRPGILPGAAAVTDTLDEGYNRVMDFLCRAPAPVLLVFDNLEDPGDANLDDLACLPAQVKVIANSRLDVPGFAGWKLDFLSAGACRELFYRYYDVEEDHEGVEEIVARCARHTLTVELLARTAQNAGLKVRDLGKLLAEKGFNLNAVIGDKVETFWHDVKDRKRFFDHLLTLFDLSGVNEAELALMVNLAVLPAVYIGSAEIKEWLGLGDNEGLTALVQKGWLRRDKGNIYMHPVVQEVTRVKAAPALETCKRLIKTLTDKLYVEPGENPLDKKGWVGFAETVLGYVSGSHEEIATLANNISLIFLDLGQLEKALEFQLKTVEIFEKVLAKDHPDLATSYNNLSQIYQDLGQLEKALEFQLKANEIYEKVLDCNHPLVATSYNNVSMIYQDLGQLEKALSFQLKTLEIKEKVLDKDHPSLATSYNNVSMIYKNLGQLEKALEFQLKDIAISEEVLGKDHPSLATSYNNVSTIYYAMGQLEKALSFQLKALEIREKVLD